MPQCSKNKKIKYMWSVALPTTIMFAAVGAAAALLLGPSQYCDSCYLTISVQTGAVTRHSPKASTALVWNTSVDVLAAAELRVNQTATAVFAVTSSPIQYYWRGVAHQPRSCPAPQRARIISVAVNDYSDAFLFLQQSGKVYRLEVDANEDVVCQLANASYPTPQPNDLFMSAAVAYGHHWFLIRRGDTAVIASPAINVSRVVPLSAPRRPTPTVDAAGCLATVQRAGADVLLWFAGDPDRDTAAGRYVAAPQKLTAVAGKAWAVSPDAKLTLAATGLACPSAVVHAWPNLVVADDGAGVATEVNEVRIDYLFDGQPNFGWPLLEGDMGNTAITQIKAASTEFVQPTVSVPLPRGSSWVDQVATTAIAVTGFLALVLIIFGVRHAPPWPFIAAWFTLMIALMLMVSPVVIGVEGYNASGSICGVSQSAHAHNGVWVATLVTLGVMVLFALTFAVIDYNHSARTSLTLGGGGILLQGIVLAAGVRSPWTMTLVGWLAIAFALVAVGFSLGCKETKTIRENVYEGF